MRRAGSRTADGWWLLLITVLGWLLVSYGSHHIFDGEGSQQSDIVRRQLQTVVSTSLSPISIAGSSSPTSRRSPAGSPANVATSLSPPTNLTAVLADQRANSPSPSPAETTDPEATPEATNAGTPAPTVSSITAGTASPSPTSTPAPVSPSPSPAPTPNPVATPEVTASPTSTPTAAATVAAATATPAATSAATVAAAASPTLTPTSTLSPTPAPTVATVATPTATPVPAPTATPAATPAATVAATASPAPTPSPTPAPTIATVATPIPTPTPTPAASLPPGPPSPSSPVAEPEPEPTLTPSPLPSSTYAPSPTPISATVAPTAFPTPVSTPTPVATPFPTPAAVSSPTPAASPIPAAVSSPTPTASPTPAAVSTLVLPSRTATDAPSPVATAPPSPAATTPIPTAVSTVFSTSPATPPATVYLSPMSPIVTPPSSPVTAALASPSPLSVASPAASPVSPTATSRPFALATSTPIPSRTPAPTLAATASPTAWASPAPSPTPEPSPVPAATPTVTPAVISAAAPTPSSSPVQQSLTSVNATSPSPSALPQIVSVPAAAPSSSNISPNSPSSADVAPGTFSQNSSQNSSQGSDALAPAPDASDYGSDTPAAAPSANNATHNTTAPAVAPAAASPTAAVTAPVPAPAGAVTNSTAPVPAPSQDSAVPAPAPGLSPNASAPAPGLVAVPVPAPGVPTPAPAPTSGVPVPAPAQGVPAPAPAAAVPAPGTAAAVPVPAPAASALAVGTPSAGAPSPAASNASAPAPGSVAAGTAGSENLNSTDGTPATAPAPSTVAVPAPAVAPSVGDPDLSPVSTSQIEYQDVSTAPASWNTSGYNTTTFQVLLTNTSVGMFDPPTQTAVMNVVHSYLVADGFAEPFYMGLIGISQYLPTSDLAPGVSINISRSAAPAAPAARHLLQDISDDGVNMTITITAPASQMHDVSDLVQSVVQSSSVRRQLQEAGVGANVASVSVVVEAEGLPPVTDTVPVADLTSPAMAAPSPPAAANKSSSIGPIAGGIAGGVVIVGGAGLLLFLCKRRSRRRQWTKDLEVAKASYGDEGTSNSGDSGSSDGSARPGGRGRKVAAYMPFGTNSNESVDATPHAKHARMDDGFAGISRFKPDGTLKVPPPRQPQLISTAAGGAAASGQMGTILERKTFSAPLAQADGANLHDTANLMDSHSNNVQTAAEHAVLSPTSLFSIGTPIGRNSDPYRPPGLPSRQSDGRLSSDGSANLLLRGGSGDQLLGVQASGEYSDRFLELEPIGGRKASRQYSGNVDANLWSVAWKDLEVQKQIGEGSFGKVFLAKWRETTVAVKLLTYTGVSGSLEDNDEFVAQGMNVLLKGLEQEAGMMASMRHPNVVMYLGVCLQPPCVVTEYCARGSLNDVFKRARATPALAAQLDWGRRLNMVLDAAKGMMYLHSSEPPVIHRDLKSPNLLVDKHWRLKVCDFNLSRVMEESAILSSMAASNPRWLAPEILSGRGYTFSSDVYSFGVIMWEFLTWQIPWHECGPWQVVALVTEGAQRPELPAPKNLPGIGTFAGYPEYIMLMEQCWHQDPAARPTFAQVITVLRKLLGAEMKAKASNNAELRPQSSSTPSD